MKLFSKASEYAIRAMMHVVERGSSEPFSSKDICTVAGVPEAFARKVFQELARARILKGARGPGGGYQLVRPLSEVTLLDIVLAIDGEKSFEYCPLGLRCAAQAARGGLWACKTCQLLDPRCGLSHLCPLHRKWQQTRQLIVHDLETTTLQDIQNRLNRASVRPVRGNHRLRGRKRKTVPRR